MLQPLPPADSLISERSHRWCRIWRILRTDFQVYRFTDNATKLTYEGEEYEPAGGFSPTATRNKGGLHAGNFEIDGPITSDRITNDDLRKGAWRDAQVTERIVDWQYPQAGALRTSIYWITETEWDGEIWQATIEGGARWLRGRQGFIFTRNCRHDLGNGFVSGVGCRYDLDANTIFSVGVDAVASRVQFTGGSAITPTTREKWRFGRVVWQSGSNVGTAQEVKDFGQEGARVIELFQPTPFTITTSDAFDLVPGCDKIRSTCKDVHSRLSDFGGFPFMPGSNNLLMKPRSNSSSPTQRDRGN